MRGSDAGETLVELLVTIAVLGITTAGISGALLATNKASTMHRQQAVLQNALRSWAEQVSAAGYTDCAGPGSVAAPDPAPPAGFTPSVAAVRYWNGTGFGTTCGPDTGIQRVTLRITAPNGLSPTLTETVAVIVRKPCVASC